MMNSDRLVAYQKAQEFNPKEFLQPGLNETDIIQLREVFADFNTTRSGFLNPNELRAAFKKYLKMNISRKTMYKILSRFDNDMQGDLCFEDFVLIASTIREDNLAKYEIKSIFESRWSGEVFNERHGFGE